MWDKFLEGLSSTKWPLLIIGLIIMILASGMFGPSEERSDARALMLGVGAILLGAGLVRLVYSDKESQEDKHERTNSGDSDTGTGA